MMWNFGSSWGAGWLWMSVTMVFLWGALAGVLVALVRHQDARRSADPHHLT